MRLTRAIVLLAVLLLPLLSWTAGLGGLPLCCLGMNCPMAASARPMKHCTMRAAGCRLTPVPQLRLTPPAPLLPTAAAAIPVALAVEAANCAGPRRASTAGWPSGVFHPPQS